MYRPKSIATLNDSQFIDANFPGYSVPLRQSRDLSDRVAVQPVGQTLFCVAQLDIAVLVIIVETVAIKTSRQRETVASLNRVFLQRRLDSSTSLSRIIGARDVIWFPFLS